jgi:hypothetical protein
MRTIHAAAAMLKELDPGTDITPYRLRAWVLSGTVPHVTAGNKRLLNVDALMEMLADGNLQAAEPEPLHGNIRRIS